MSKLTKESLEALLKHNGFVIPEDMYHWRKKNISLYLGKDSVEITINHQMVAYLYYEASVILSALELYIGQLEPVPEPTLHDKLIADGWEKENSTYTREDVVLCIYFNRPLFAMQNKLVKMHDLPLSYELIKKSVDYLEISDNYLKGK